MSLAAETTGTQGQMRTALASGLDALDLNQVVTFTLYRRVVLPFDGFVFWIRADQLSQSALVNSSAVNSGPVNQTARLTGLAPVIEAQGSLHHTTVNKQSPDESSSQNRLVFTSKCRVNDLNDLTPDGLYMAEVDGHRYAFSTRSGWYQQAGLYHYSGDAVYPAMATQVIDNPADFEGQQIVVSNSLPIWLRLNQLFPVYPSFLVPDNLPPPYAVIDIGEDSTTPLQSGATHDETGTRWQLVKDIVNVTTYGVRNDTIMDWLDIVNDYTLNNPGVIGVMNSPVPRDAKRGQVEISALAQKKVITFEVSYYQARALQVARQLITEAFLKYIIAPVPVTPRTTYVWSWVAED